MTTTTYAPCKWCSGPVRKTRYSSVMDKWVGGTKMCDRCWELDRRISANLELAKRILVHYEDVESMKEDERPDGICGPLEEGYCQVCGVHECLDHN